jgi:hypothetical protein
VTKSTPPITVAVEGGRAPEPQIAAGPAPAVTAAAPATGGSAVTLDADQIAAVPPTPAPRAATRSAGPGTAPAAVPSGSVAVPLWALAAVPAALLILGGSALAVKARAGRKVDARSALTPEANETKERAAARIERAVRDWLQARHGIPDGLSAASVEGALQDKPIAPEVRSELVALLLELEFLRFAPQLGDYTAKIAEVRARAARLLPRLK